VEAAVVAELLRRIHVEAEAEAAGEAEA